MPMSRQEVIACVEMLADQIAQASPECTERAMRIRDMMQELRMEPDHAAIRDAIEISTLDADLSGSRVYVATSAVFDVLGSKDP